MEEKMLLEQTKILGNMVTCKGNSLTWKVVIIINYYNSLKDSPSHTRFFHGKVSGYFIAETCNLKEDRLMSTWPLSLMFIKLWTQAQGSDSFNRLWSFFGEGFFWGKRASH